jgi:hypothetical protein
MVKFGSLSQETLIAGVALGSVLLFILGAGVAALFHLYAKNRLSRGVSVEPRPRPVRTVRPLRNDRPTRR